MSSYFGHWRLEVVVRRWEQDTLGIPQTEFVTTSLGHLFTRTTLAAVQARAALCCVLSMLGCLAVINAYIGIYITFPEWSLGMHSGWEKPSHDLERSVNLGPFHGNFSLLLWGQPCWTQLKEFCVTSYLFSYLVFYLLLASDWGLHFYSKCPEWPHYWCCPERGLDSLTVLLSLVSCELLRTSQKHWWSWGSTLLLRMEAHSSKWKSPVSCQPYPRWQRPRLTVFY